MWVVDKKDRLHVHKYLNYPTYSHMWAVTTKKSTSSTWILNIHKLRRDACAETEMLRTSCGGGGRFGGAELIT